VGGHLVTTSTQVTHPEVVDFQSPSNGRRFAVWAWTPPTPGPHPVLLLLHGVLDSGGHGWWMKARAHEAVMRLVDEGLTDPPILIMPTDTGIEAGSAYADWADGSSYAETFLIDELLPWVAETMPTDGRRWISGLSMGGYGALLLALRNPGLFESASAMSGFADPRRLSFFIPDVETRIWGGDVAPHDVTELIRDPARREGLRIALDCGVEDHLIRDNRAFHAELEAQGIAHSYVEHPGGHTWEYWAEHIADHVLFHAGMDGVL
jgi:putative tributyrin esterase